MQGGGTQFNFYR